MRCYCCDREVDGPQSFDPPTGRYYCVPCFEPTVEEQLRIQEKSKNDSLADQILQLNPDYRDDVEKFFSKATEEEEQNELERIYYGDSDFTRDWN